MQQWPIYHFATSQDKLILLENGHLRHYIRVPDDSDDEAFNMKHMIHNEDEDEEKPRFYDYEPGHYCMDKAVLTKENNSQAQFAMVCHPQRASQFWTPDFVLKKIVKPICHAISIIILLVIAIIYFVLPTLRYFIDYLN